LKKSLTALADEKKGNSMLYDLIEVYQSFFIGILTLFSACLRADCIVTFDFLHHTNTLTYLLTYLNISETYSNT